MSPPSPPISPPPLKRRRLSPTPRPSSPPSPPPPPPRNAQASTLTPPNPPTLRIYSWNINGITPYLPPQSRPITSFFPTQKPSATKSSTQSPSSPGSKSPNLKKNRDNHNDPSSLRENLVRWSFPHLVLLQEIKIAPSDTHAKARIARAVNTPSDGEDEDNKALRSTYDVHLSLPRDAHNGTGFGGRVYGVCALIRRDLNLHPNNITSNNDGASKNNKVNKAEEQSQEYGKEDVNVNVRTPHWDLEGRIQILSLHTQNLIIINIYAVNGTTNAYRSPVTGKVVGDRHTHKRNLHVWLYDECRGYMDKGWSVVVAGDMNVALEGMDSWPGLRMGEEHVRNRNHFRGLFLGDGDGDGDGGVERVEGREVGMVRREEREGRVVGHVEVEGSLGRDKGGEGRYGLGMRDSFREIWGQERKFSYRPRHRQWGEGMDRVDLILVSRGVRLKDADILDDERERGRSDHCPLWVEVEIGGYQAGDEGGKEMMGEKNFTGKKNEDDEE